MDILRLVTIDPYDYHILLKFLVLVVFSMMAERVHGFTLSEEAQPLTINQLRFLPIINVLDNLSYT